MKVILTGFFICVSALLNAQPVSYNQEFRVNTQTQDIQENPSVSGLADGKFIICWQSATQDGSGMGIFGQLFNNDGSRYGDEFLVNSYTERSQSFPNVSDLSDGKFVICWNSIDQDGSGYGIYGQLFKSDGSRYGQEFRVNSYTKSDQICPVVSGLTDGKFVVCWQSKGQDSSGYGIYGQLFDSSGVKYGQEFRVITYTSNYLYNPTVSALSDGGFVVCWANGWQDSIAQGIYCRIYNSEGDIYDDEFRVNTYTFDSQREPCAIGLSDDKFVICWQSRGQDGSDYGIYGQLFNNDGTRYGAEFPVNTYTESEQARPSISSLSKNKFVVCWHSYNQDGSTYGVYGQLFNNVGSRYGKEFLVNTYTHNYQYRSSISRISNEKFVICWQSFGQDNSWYEIYGKYYQEELIHPMQSFSLLIPDNNENVKTIHPNLTWSQTSQLHINFPWELEYKLYIDESEEFNSQRIIEAIYDTTYSIDSLSPGTSYFWKVLAKNIEGDSLWSSETFGFFVNHDATLIKRQKTNYKSQSFQLYGNYPNPFNPQTNIGFYLPQSENIEIAIYDVLGRKVKTLLSGRVGSGSHTAIWNGTNDSGLRCASGIYYYRLRVGEFAEMKKMLLVE